MCLAPACKSFLSPIRPAVWLKGGFITTTDGRTLPFSSAPICSPFSPWTFPAPNWSFRNAARRGSSSLVTTFAPAFFAWIASEPVPADGSSTVSVGFRFATQFAAKA